MTKKWNISDADLPLVEHAIGAASLDKLRGHKSSLVHTYAALGGKDPDSNKHLEQYEKGFATVNLSAAVKELSPSGEFNHLYQKWDMSSHELALVQRAIGSAILQKIEGRPKSMADCYKTFGGRNHEALVALDKVHPMFEKGNPELLAQ